MYSMTLRLYSNQTPSRNSNANKALDNVREVFCAFYVACQLVSHQKIHSVALKLDSVSALFLCGAILLDRLTPLPKMTIKHR